MSPQEGQSGFKVDIRKAFYAIFQLLEEANLEPLQRLGTHILAQGLSFLEYVVTLIDEQVQNVTNIAATIKESLLCWIGILKQYRDVWHSSKNIGSTISNWWSETSSQNNADELNETDKLNSLEEKINSSSTILQILAIVVPDVCLVVRTFCSVATVLNASQEQTTAEMSEQEQSTNEQVFDNIGVQISNQSPNTSKFQVWTLKLLNYTCAFFDIVQDKTCKAHQKIIKSFGKVDSLNKLVGGILIGVEKITSLLCRNNIPYMAAVNSVVVVVQKVRLGVALMPVISNLLQQFTTKASTIANETRQVVTNIFCKSLSNADQHAQVDL